MAAEEIYFYYYFKGLCVVFYLQGHGMSSKVHLVTHSQMLLTTFYFSIDISKALANAEADPAGAV